jgi:hypothetical protein
MFLHYVTIYRKKTQFFVHVFSVTVTRGDVEHDGGTGRATQDTRERNRRVEGAMSVD